MSYFIGSTLTYSKKFTNSSGSDADPATVRFVLQEAIDGTELEWRYSTTPVAGTHFPVGATAMVRDSEGDYHVSYIARKTERHVGYWLGSGVVYDSSQTTYFVRHGDVLTAPIVFDPAVVTQGAVTSWFRLGHPQSTITGSGYSSIYDVLNPSSPATQSTDARRPPPATSTNGLPILNVSTAVLNVPLIAARVNTATWGFWGWINQSATADALIGFSASGGVSAEFVWFNFNTSGTNCKAELWSGASSRVANRAITAGTWKFLTLEYNAAFSGDARFTITIDGAVVTPTFSGALSSMPASLPAVTGTGSLFAFGPGNFAPFVGNVGPNFGFLGATMAGVTEGLLTSSARLALMGFEAPT